MYQQLDFNITQIETGLMGTEVAACYLLESDGEVAIIETGNYATTENVLILLKQRKLSKDNVRFVIPTHVHLDHAGGASSLMDALPNAKLVIHPRGAAHMIDPSKLIAGATVVYGEEKFKQFYGEIKPIDEQRVIVAEDNTSLVFGTRELLFRDTPGHANHHFCVWDKMSEGWFTGDTFGIGYPSLGNNGKPYIFPSTTPVQFNPEALIRSIELMMSYKPKKMYLTHFGAVNVDQSIADNLCKQVNDYVAIVNSIDENIITVKEIKSRLKEYIIQGLAAHGSTVTSEKLESVIAMDLELNSQGLMVWYSRRQSKKLH